MQVVIGAGEVGTALYNVLRETYPDVSIRDVEDVDPVVADVIHICFPWSPLFEDYVQGYQDLYKPSLTIIHSTVPVGTSKRLGAVHSPVRGKHPNLEESLTTFVKFVSGDQADEAAGILSAAGMECAIAGNSRNTEAGKLWELTQYGLNIAIEKYIHDWCDINEVDFDVVYTQFAQTYNDGYEQLGDHQFVRPVLRHIPGPIGGHCVVPGSQLLHDELADMVAQAGVNELVTK